jgi:putative addiction module component (TIGR02574 family)
MAAAAKKVELEAMKLPRRSRARLAKRLLLSLEAVRGTRIQEAWFKEAERRYEAYRKGEVQGIPAEEALREARSRLR